MSEKAKGWIYVLIQFLLLGIIVLSSRLERKYFNLHYSETLAYIGIGLTFAGLLLFIISLISFRQRVTPNPVPKENYKLRTTGLYSFVRHPIYFSLLVMFTGIAIHFNAYISLIWVVILFIFFIEKTNLEEGYLIQKFPEYKEYQSKTKRLIPYIYFLT